MFEFTRVLLVFTGSFLLAACASTPDKMVNLHMGMSRAEAISTMGSPTSVSSKGNGEYLNYNLCVTNCMAPPPARGFDSFYVRLINGRVESFGRTGDFDSAKIPTTRVEIDRTDKVSQEVRSKQDGDLYTELKKLKDLLDSGVLTQEEFDSRKKVLLTK